MSEIDPIPDDFIDDIIKANQTGTPDPNKTSGAGMRELIKRLRDRFEQGIANANGGNFYKGEWAVPSDDTLDAPVLSAGVPTANSIPLTWTIPANTTGFVLQRATNADFTGLITIYQGTGISFTDTGLSLSTLYYYRIRGTAAGFEDSDYATASGTTAAGEEGDNSGKSLKVAFADTGVNVTGWNNYTKDMWHDDTFEGPFKFSDGSDSPWWIDPDAPWGSDTKPPLAVPNTDFPNEVTAQLWWDSDFSYPQVSTITISGLDITKKYKVQLFMRGGDTPVPVTVQPNSETAQSGTQDTENGIEFTFNTVSAVAGADDVANIILTMTAPSAGGVCISGLIVTEIATRKLLQTINVALETNTRTVPTIPGHWNTWIQEETNPELVNNTGANSGLHLLDFFGTYLPDDIYTDNPNDAVYPNEVLNYLVYMEPGTPKQMHLTGGDPSLTYDIEFAIYAGTDDVSDTTDTYGVNLDYKIQGAIAHTLIKLKWVEKVPDVDGNILLEWFGADGNYAGMNGFIVKEYRSLT